MKSRIKRQGSTELPRFVVGALATAGASAASAATVQISFANNYVSSSGGANLVADLTGDGTAESLFCSNSGQLALLFRPSHAYGKAQAIYLAAGVVDYYAKVADAGPNVIVRNGVASKQGLANFVFTDPRINSGQPSNGFLDLTATAGPGKLEVKINRLIFDSSSTVAPTGASTGSFYSEWTASVAAVPEPSSSLGLLALGAGGLLIRRRKEQAA